MSTHLDPAEARRILLDPLLAARSLLSTLEGAEACGVLGLLVKAPSTVCEIAQRSGLDLAVVDALTDSLIASDVVKRHGELIALTGPWHAVCTPGGFTPLAAVLQGDRIAADQLRNLGTSDDYWSLPSSDRIAMAASVSPDPVEGSFVNIVKRLAENGHRYALAGSQAKRRLELGCGLAGAALSELVAFPEIRQVVGVELSEDLAAEAERRAEVLGVAHRFTVVRGDAADFVNSELFDVGFWSQYFFTEDARTGALNTLFRQVRPGGTVAAPVMWYDSDSGPPNSVAAQRYTQFRLRAQSWGVPERSPGQLEDEFGAVGFVDMQTIVAGPTESLFVATRP